MKRSYLKIFTSLMLVVIIVASMFAAFSVGTSAAGDVYELVTSESYLEVGGKYLIACTSKNVVMGAQSGTYNHT